MALKGALNVSNREGQGKKKPFFCQYLEIGFFCYNTSQKGCYYCRDNIAFCVMSHFMPKWSYQPFFLRNDDDVT